MSEEKNTLFDCRNCDGGGWRGYLLELFSQQFKRLMETYSDFMEENQYETLRVYPNESGRPAVVALNYSNDKQQVGLIEITESEVNQIHKELNGEPSLFWLEGVEDHYLAIIGLNDDRIDEKDSYVKVTGMDLKIDVIEDFFFGIDWVDSFSHEENVEVELYNAMDEQVKTVTVEVVAEAVKTNR